LFHELIADVLLGLEAGLHVLLESDDAAGRRLAAHQHVETGHAVGGSRPQRARPPGPAAGGRSRPIQRLERGDGRPIDFTDLVEPLSPLERNQRVRVRGRGIPSTLPGSNPFPFKSI
jgi:hypothetical protein